MKAGSCFLILNAIIFFNYLWLAFIEALIFGHLNSKAIFKSKLMH